MRMRLGAYIKIMCVVNLYPTGFTRASLRVHAANGETDTHQAPSASRESDARRRHISPISRGPVVACPRSTSWLSARARRANGAVTGEMSAGDAIAPKRPARAARDALQYAANPTQGA